MKTSRWPLAIVCAFLIISSTACACADRLSGVFRQAAQAPTPTVAVPTAVNTVPLAIPDEPDTAFEGELSAADIERLLQEQIPEAKEYINELDIQITEEAILANLKVNASQLNITFGLTAAVQPSVQDGIIYLKVTQITLDNTLTGWTRLSAKSLIQQILDKYSGEQGIPLDLKDLYIEAVELRPGKIYIRGRTP